MKTKLLLAATFFYFSNFANAQPGRLDPTFRNGGIVKTGLGKNYNYQVSYVRQILPQANGDMYVVQGPFTGWEDYGKKSLTRRHANGAIDSGFGLLVNGFSADAGFAISRAAVQPDGKIVAAGSVEAQKVPDAQQSDFALARFKTDGSLDSSFSHDGKLTTDFGDRYDDEGSLVSWDRGYAIAIQKDGKIVAAGYSNEYLALARYNPDGSPDKTFNATGLLTTNIYHSFSYPTPVSIAFQSDGKMVVTGGFPVIARFNTNGSTDIVFSGGENYSFEGVYTEAIQKDGKIIVNDYSSHGLGLARYNTNGSLDTSFSHDGTQQLDYGTEVLIQEDQKIIVAGDSIGSYFTIRRFNPDGSFDNTFDKDGRQETDFGFGYNQPYAAALQSDGKLLVAGAAMPYMAIARYNTNGSLDHSLDKDGELTDSSHLGKAFYNKTITQKDGKIIASGKAWNGSAFEYVIARYNTNGHLDRSFSGNGILTTGITTLYEDESAFAIALQNDEKIVAAIGNYLIRYNADGSLDNTFSNDGKQTTDSIIYISAVAVGSDGKIVTAGGANVKDQYGYNVTNPAVVRYNTDGSLDKTFGTNGRQILKSSDEGAFRSVAIQNNGKIVLAAIVFDGEYDGSVVLARLYKNGGTDSSFGYKGTSNAPIGANSCDIALQSDGKIVVAGSGDDHDTGNTDVVRLNSNGTIDTGFYRNGGFNEYYKSTRNTSVAVQNDGKIVVSGIEFFRLNTNGRRDTTFNTKAAQEVDFRISDIAVSNNKLYAVGGETSGAVARYLLDNDNTSPVVSITSPANNTVYVAPARVTITASASDPDGVVYSVRFYNGKKYLKTDFTSPYTYTLSNLAAGTYTLTAKATDFFGAETTSAPVTITVEAPNQAPAVSIISPADNQTYADSATIHLVAAAADTDGKIAKVQFYNESALLKTEYKYPYTYIWKNVPAGTYTITAVATDNRGAKTTSAPVNIEVLSSAIVSGKPSSQNEKIALNDALTLRLSPNPASDIVNIQPGGLQQNKPATLSIISISGNVLKNIQISKTATQLDVSSLISGVYTIKIVSGERILYKQFVKL